MIMNPDISIVVPVYNSEKHISKTLLSLRNQLLENIEIIIVDDFSEDASLNIIIEHAKADERVKVISFDGNRSSNQARKQGALVATGKYLMFVDSDDMLDERACSSLLSIMNASPVDVLHFGCEIINCNGVAQSTIDYLTRDAMPDNKTVTANDNLLSHWFSRQRAGLIWGKLFKTSVVQTALAQAEDLILPRAQDLYAIFLILHCAKTYKGLVGNEFRFYKYFYGRGGFGKKTEDFVFFNKLCHTAYVSDAIERFLIAAGALKQYSELLAKIKQSLMSGCTARFLKAPITEKPLYFDCLIQYWGAEPIIEWLSTNFWYRRMWLAKQLSGVAVMKPIAGKKIKTIGAFYHSIRNGGAQRVCAELCGLWHRIGYNVVLFTDSPETADDYFVPPEVIRVVLPDSQKAIKNGYISRAKVLREAIDFYHIDAFVNHAWVNSGLFFDILTVKSCGAYFINHCHNIFTILNISNNKNFYELPKTFAFSDLVLALSRVDYTYWSQFCPKVSIVTNPNFFNVNDVVPSERDSKTIIWIARFSDEKRPMDALKILKLVVDRIPDVKLLIVGEANQNNIYHSAIKKVVSESGLENNVELVGFTNDIAKYYRQSSLMLVTSKYEGFPLTFLESFSFGLPVVSYDMPYLEVMRKAEGIVKVPQGDIESAAEAVINVLQDKDYGDLLGYENREFAKQHAKSDLGEMWKGFFNSLENGKAITYEPTAEDYRILFQTFAEHGEYTFEAIEKMLAAKTVALKK